MDHVFYTVSLMFFLKTITAILVGADLTQLSSKKVRKQLEEEYGQELFEQYVTFVDISILC